MRTVPRQNDGTDHRDAVLVEVAEVLALDRSDRHAQRRLRQVRTLARLHGYRPVRVRVTLRRPRRRRTRSRARRAASRGSTRAGPGEDPPGSTPRAYAALAGVRA